MPKLQCNISESLWKALEKRHKSTGETVAQIVMKALADSLQIDHATLFQVSTSGALVEGLYEGAVSVKNLLEHGNFGLGTFEGLDGEMIVLDGKCYQAISNGTVKVAPQNTQVPFAVVTHFQPEKTTKFMQVSSFDALNELLDKQRNTENLFFAIRIHGDFEYIKFRTACKATGHETLVESAKKQAEFELQNIRGTLVGFWTPEYAKTVNIAGYHLHFLSDDKQKGGHLLDCRAKELNVKIEHSADFRMAIPETSEFLRADLTKDPTKALDQAER